ncbi:homocitrate synthase/isopropylmalate synthase family protein [Actinacidiphila epipremni]|nr:alpha-isopropylmalate synthase regulatory domain-containing protein [Actinacidiphila epipremni]
MRTMPAGTPLGDAFHLYDTTLRDGAQREGISYSVAEKLAVARTLDALGVGFVEGGWPGALPKDTAFFARAAAELDLRHAVLVAFGSTRKPGRRAADDPQVRALLDSRAPVVTLVAKSDRRHIERALRTDAAENCAMVRDTVGFLVGEGRRVFLDAEHFFDGYAADPDTALRVLDAAVGAGADVAVLCDTNGGQLPGRFGEIVAEVIARTGFRVGVHCQDDTGCAVANTVAGVEAGATHVQCTANGYGERAGNADLFTVAGNLSVKLGMPVLPPARLQDLTRTARSLADSAHLPLDRHRPYVGGAVFAHKAGLHASAVKVDPLLYNHVDPARVGNDTRVIVSEMAGRASVELKCLELGLDIPEPAALARAVARVKELEAAGWSFESADASLELLLREEFSADAADNDADDDTDGAGRAAGAGSRGEPFVPVGYHVVERHEPGAAVCEATVRLRIPDVRDTAVWATAPNPPSAAEAAATAAGPGPVEALDAALRRALSPLLPWTAETFLTGVAVRVLDGGPGRAALTRVHVTSRDAEGEWTTVGVHTGLAAAGMHALRDAFAYKALRARRQRRPASSLSAADAS